MSDLSQVPVCPKCGLEVANEQIHAEWHRDQESLRQAILRLIQLLQTPKVAESPRNPWSDPYRPGTPLPPSGKWYNDTHSHTQ